MSGSFAKWMGEHPDQVEHVRKHGASAAPCKQGQGNASLCSGASGASLSSENSADEA
jgi:hypothetical protein